MQSARTRSADKDNNSLINRNCTDDSQIEINEFAQCKRNNMFEYIDLCINLEDLICILTFFNYSADISLLNQ